MDKPKDTRRDERRRKQDRDRSRSPPPRDRRDDRRRERSPPRGPSARGPPHRSDRERDYDRRDRGRQQSGTPPPSSRRGDDRRPPPRQPLDSRTNNATGARGKQNPVQGKDTKMQNGFEDEDSEAEMRRVMGFKGFKSTKNTKVPGNDKNYGVSKAKTTEYRQYMNRVGGFNRPLSPSRM